MMFIVGRNNAFFCYRYRLWSNIWRKFWLELELTVWLVYFWRPCWWPLRIFTDLDYLSFLNSYSMSCPIINWSRLGLLINLINLLIPLIESLIKTLQDIPKLIDALLNLVRAYFTFNVFFIQNSSRLLIH